MLQIEQLNVKRELMNEIMYLFKVKVSWEQLTASPTHIWLNALRFWPGARLAARRLPGLGAWPGPSPGTLAVWTRTRPRLGATAARGSSTMRTWTTTPTRPRPWSCHLYSQFPAIQHTSIHGVKRILSIALVVETDESKATTFPCEAVPGDVNISNLAATLENPA